MAARKTYHVHYTDDEKWREISRDQVPQLAPTEEVWEFTDKPNGGAVVFQIVAAVLGDDGEPEEFMPAEPAAEAEAAGKNVRWYQRA